METYSIFERVLSGLFAPFPRLKDNLKAIYQVLNYGCFGELSFQVRIHPRVEMFTPAKWIGCSEELTSVFFGYYDKSPWSIAMDYGVYCHLGVEHNQLEIIVYNKQEQCLHKIGISHAWNYQQGCMTQWLPSKNRSAVIFNDVVKGNLAARIVMVEKKWEKVVPWPIQALHPGGQTALTLNYKRLYRLRPAYGYSVAAYNFSENQPLEDDGVWQVNLDSGQRELLISLRKLADYEPRPEVIDAEHKVNHLMYSPQGTRFVFVHRWLAKRGKFSRLYVFDMEDESLKLLLDDRMVSHYTWQDEEHLLVWARTKEFGDHYYLLDVLTGHSEIIGEGILDVYGDGHPSFSPDRRWILTDTYPDRARQQHLLLYEVNTGKLMEIGKFLAPLRFSGHRRCDLHPRWSPDGTMISIDSAHTGTRKSYILDVSGLLEAYDG